MCRVCVVPGHQALAVAQAGSEAGLGVGALGQLDEARGLGDAAGAAQKQDLKWVVFGFGF